MINKEKRTIDTKKDIDEVEKILMYNFTKIIKGRKDYDLRLFLHKYTNKLGYTSLEEYLNLANSLRAYLKNFKEPFIDKHLDDEKARFYEWQNEDGVRFRLITNTTSGEGLPKTPLSPTGNVIIAFYSDRNDKKMTFINPKVSNFYDSFELNQNLDKLLNLAKQKPSQVKQIISNIKSFLKEAKAKNLKVEKDIQARVKSLANQYKQTI